MGWDLGAGSSHITGRSGWTRQETQVMRCVGCVETLQHLRLHFSKSRVRMKGTAMFAEAGYAGSKLRNLIPVIKVLCRHKHRGCFDSGWRFSTQQSGQQQPTQYRPQGGRQGHPPRIPVNAGINGQSNMATDLPQRPIAVTPVTRVKESLALSDSVLECVKMQDSPVHETRLLAFNPSPKITGPSLPR